MCDFRTYSHELLTEFIEAFRNNPCLWKLRSNDYKDKNLKLQAYNNLLEIIRKVERDATIENVKKKINSLRAGFRKEHKKVQDSKKTGSGTDQVYVPKLWYYSQLEFLKDQGQVERRIEHVICRQGENGGRQERGRGTSNTFSDLRDASLGERKMADTNVIFTSKLLKKFILMYKELPCLWDRKCVTYKHKKNRNEAVSKLTELVQQYDKSATRLHVLRKIESMRACVRRAHRRVMQSRLTATNPDDIYNPNLWYYDMLSFVFDEERDTTTVVKDSPETEIEEADSLEQNEEEEYDGRIEYQEYALPTNVIEENPPMQKFNYEDEKSKRHCTEVDDEYDAIGINVAAKLRGLPANMRIPAEKLINDVLYQAQMNCLTSTTVITTPDPIKHDRGY